MSILIKGMEMPKNCIYCELYEADWYWCRAAKKEYYETIENKAHPDWCPLIEVPPHGRLIDADALIMSDKPVSRMMMFGGQFIYTQSEIDDAPTIIEAETCNNSENTCNKEEDDAVNASIESEE